MSKFRYQQLLLPIICLGLPATIYLTLPQHDALASWRQDEKTKGAPPPDERGDTDIDTDADSDAGSGKDADDAEGAPGTVDAVTPPQRVVLQTGRDQFVYGTVESDTPTVISIETADGEIESFVKARLLGLTYLVDPAPGQHGVVVLKDGTRRQGVLIEDTFERVLIEVNGVKTSFDRAIVREVQLSLTVEQQYQKTKATIKPTQYDMRFKLSRWLVERGAFELAAKELSSLLDDQPNYSAARDLMRQVNAQLALRKRSEREGTIDPSDRIDLPGDNPNVGPVDQVDMLPDDLLTREQVNLIKVYEIDFRRPPEVEVSADTIRTLIVNYGSHKAIPASADERAQLFRAKPLEIVDLMFQVRARDLYKEVNVLSEPYAMNLFRHRVHNTWLINNCATSRCHGGVRAGRLFLHNRNHRDDRVRYTNFLTLERLTIPDKPPLINYNEPSESLILQYGMPVTQARYPHPEVRGWRPVFLPGNRDMLEDAINWIRAMYQPRPEYPVEWQPPTLHVDDGQDEFGVKRTDR